eukprot:scaffold279853_cov16-Prasinocladus_malaysianus.AAC.1
MKSIPEVSQAAVWVRHFSQGDEPAELVHTYLAMNGQHPSFGELSLMYGKPRAATVIARTQADRRVCVILQCTDTR